MKTKISKSPQAEHLLSPSIKTAMPDYSFESDWQNGISGKEFEKRAHKHIKEWWHANRENKKA